MGKEGVPSAVVTLPQEHDFTKAGERTCRLQARFLRKKIFKVTVAASDRSLLAFGGGGNVFIGKGLCG